MPATLAVIWLLSWVTKKPPDKIAVKIGRGDWSPNSAGGKEWRVAVTGQNVAVWASFIYTVANSDIDFRALGAPTK